MTWGGPPVLVVADCEGSDEILRDLRRHGLLGELVSTGAEAMSRYEEFQLVLVDLDLEDFDGLTLCREMRKVSDIPMIGFTSSEMNRILALEGGCDDCIDKPYSSREFMARISALLRRSRVSSSSALAFGELSIHPTTREVRVGDRSVKATRKEFELLHLLASHSDSLFSRAELLRRVWQFNVVQDEVTPLASRTIDTHVSSLRKKLGAPDWIVTVRGVGFRFNDPDASHESH